ncbi:MAG: hypothetical protein ACKOQM_02450 [Novosphingobium sp.]
MALFIATILLIGIAISFALVRGGSPEKTVAWIMLSQVLAGFVGHWLTSFHYTKIDVVSAVTDSIGFAGFCLVAIFARRVWPLWVSSLQLIALMAHVIRGLNIPIHPIAYAIISWAPSDLIPLTLILGTVNQLRRQQKSDSSPSWRDWSNPSSL